MANTAQARKRARQNDKQRAHNASLKSSFRTAIKKIIKAVSSGDKKVAKETFDSNVAIIDDPSECCIIIPSQIMLPMLETAQDKRRGQVK